MILRAWTRMKRSIPLKNSSPYSPRELSFPHAFSGGSTVLTTGGIRIGPPIRAFGGDGFGTHISLSSILEGHTKNTRSDTSRDGSSCLPCVQAKGLLWQTMKRF
jgi:hypothetical protein